MATKTETSKPTETAGSSNRIKRGSGSMSRVTIVGRLVSDPVMRYTSNGTAVANFRVAVNNGDEPNIHDIVVWRRLAEVSSEYLTKGRRVYVEGSLKGRTWIGRDGVKRYTLDIVASRVQFLSPPVRPAGGVQTAAAA